MRNEEEKKRAKETQTMSVKYLYIAQCVKSRVNLVHQIIARETTEEVGCLMF